MVLKARAAAKYVQADQLRQPMTTDSVRTLLEAFRLMHQVPRVQPLPVSYREGLAAFPVPEQYREVSRGRSGRNGCSLCKACGSRTAGETQLWAPGRYVSLSAPPGPVKEVRMHVLRAGRGAH